VTKIGSPPQYQVVDESDRPAGSGLAAFDAIYTQEFAYVWRTLGRLGVLPADLADAAHDVFVVLHERWRDVDPNRPIRPWLFGVARRVAAKGRRKRGPDTEPIDDVLAPEDTTFAERDLLWRALAMLDEERRVVIILHELEGHTGAAIAEMLDLSPNTVHSRLRLGRADLTAAVRRLRGGT
jgi:RNA polymerase sigma-70 factor, ECF subfamily